MCQHRPSPSRIFLMLSAGALLLLLAIFVGMQIWVAPWYKNIKAEFTAMPYNRTITVDGDGKVTVKPDIARISLSVASTGRTVKEVTDDNTKKMNDVLSMLKNLGIKPEDMQTSSYNLYPQYDYSPPVYINNSTVPEAKAPKIVGYNLSQTVDVKIRDLTKTDDVIDQSIKVGANEVGSLTFDVDDLSPVKAEARKLAFQKAKDKAQQMASAAGVSIGRVETFSEGSTGGFYPVQANYAMKTMGAVDAVAAPAPAIEPGSQDVTVTVSVTYEIE